MFAKTLQIEWLGIQLNGFLNFIGLQTYIFASCYTNNMKKISAIIFDLGGVLIDLDQNKTIRAFKRLGLTLEDLNEESTIFTDFETGKITSDDFRHALKSSLKGNITETQIDNAWNAMLLDIVEERFVMLESLKHNYKIYLLSNTNSIHIESIKKYIDVHFGWDRWCNLFNAQFLSYEIGLRKPHVSIYEFVLKHINLTAQEVLFIDDNITNLNAAKAIGIHTMKALQPLDEKLFAEIKSYIKG